MGVKLLRQKGIYVCYCKPITNLCNSFLGFPFQRGRLHMAHIPSLGYSHCQVIRFKPFVFYPDKSIEVQITVNHMDTSDKSYVHDAAVSWIDDVNNVGFTCLCDCSWL